MPSLALFKPGQGYWTRVLSGIGFAVLVLSGVAFIWTQLELIGTQGSRKAPTSAVVAALAKWGDANAQPGLKAISDLQLSATPAGPIVVIKDNTQKGKAYSVPLAQFTAIFDPLIAQPAQGAKLEPLSPRDAVGVNLIPREASVSVKYESFAARNRIYIQSIVSAILVLSLGFAGYLVMNRPDIVDFFIATEGEMRKVNWPSKQELIGATWLVICGTIFMAVGIMVVDFGFLWFFQKIDVIQSVSAAAQ
jgi:preprotein translocase SecE subunit